MKNDINFVSMIYLADTDGNRFVAIYKPMSEEERKRCLNVIGKKIVGAHDLEPLIFSMCFRLMTHVFRISGLKT